MGYLILHLSSINAINGMNLTHDQAGQLYRMAREIEIVSKRIPDFTIRYRPDLSEVRDTYLEVRQYIIQGKKVPDNVEKNVMRARSIESTVIRLSLVNKTLARTGCIRCHNEPGENDVRSNNYLMTNINISSILNYTGLEKETFLAHMAGIFGNKGLVKLMSLSSTVDRLLDDSQKEILQTFNCCIIPPKDLSDPVRAGQAASGEKELDILRKVRKVPKAFWPYVRSLGLKRLEQFMVFKYPGITGHKIKANCERVGEIYEKARKLSDVDFELEKDELVAELKRIGIAKKELNKHQQNYMNALFLLIPGSSEIYHGIVTRIAVEH